MSDRPTPETTGARRVNHFDSSLPRYIVGVEVAERLERQRDELLDDLAVIRTVASYPHHPNALSAIRKIAAKAIAKATGKEIT